MREQGMKGISSIIRNEEQREKERKKAISLK
jgi:hypothetical protein